MIIVLLFNYVDRMIMVIVNVSEFHDVVTTCNNKTLKSSALWWELCTEGLNQNGARIHVSLRQDVDELRLFGWSGHGFSNGNPLIFVFDSFANITSYITVNLT